MNPWTDFPDQLNAGDQPLEFLQRVIEQGRAVDAEFIRQIVVLTTQCLDLCRRVT